MWYSNQEIYHPLHLYKKKILLKPQRFRYCFIETSGRNPFNQLRNTAMRFIDNNFHTYMSSRSMLTCTCTSTRTHVLCRIHMYPRIMGTACVISHFKRNCEFSLTLYFGINTDCCTLPLRNS